MAAARKCDRCGSYYEKGVVNMYKYEEDGVLYPVNAIRIGLWNAKIKKWKNVCLANDLCPDCAKVITEAIFECEKGENLLKTIKFEPKKEEEKGEN